MNKGLLGPTINTDLKSPSCRLPGLDYTADEQCRLQFRNWKSRYSRGHSFKYCSRTSYGRNVRFERVVMDNQVYSSCVCSLLIHMQTFDLKASTSMAPYGIILEFNIASHLNKMDDCYREHYLVNCNLTWLRKCGCHTFLFKEACRLVSAPGYLLSALL